MLLILSPIRRGRHTVVLHSRTEGFFSSYAVRKTSKWDSDSRLADPKSQACNQCSLLLYANPPTHQAPCLVGPQGEKSLLSL